MLLPKRFRNPFYALALLVGLLFTVTACADGILMLKANRAGALPRPGEPGFVLMDLLDRYGTEILVGELVALGICTVAAIRLDHVRDREKGTRGTGQGSEG